MAIIKFGERWINTDNISLVQRHVHSKSDGTEHETYTVKFVGGDSTKLDSTKGDFLVANMGIVTNGPA